MASFSSSIQYVDELYFAALFDKDEIFPISDEDYAEEITLQEALYDNVGINQHKIHGKNKERGQSSIKLCMICMETDQEMFRINGCGHSFCSDCISKHVAAKIQENIMMVRCPDLKCKGAIEPQDCRTIVPKQVLDRWEDALCESLILGAEKFYCPFKDCSAMLVDDGGGRGGVVTAAECPYCRRMFCAQCKVAWHAGIECRVFQAMNQDERKREDMLLIQLADRKKWRRCPKCKYFVEKTTGCEHISCRYDPIIIYLQIYYQLSPMAVLDVQNMFYLLNYLARHH
ncbi:hypothetical protein Leryth_012138 [Lithospermum erythrorhizon]|nr:hypothetical protein Leryth_012138 [Lithospermum erythrorhizon]